LASGDFARNDTRGALVRGFTLGVDRAENYVALPDRLAVNDLIANSAAVDFSLAPVGLGEK